MRRRQFITLLGSAAAWPFAARAQQVATPVIGILGARTRDESADNYIALKEGLRDAGYVEGRNLAIEYRFAENHYERLPSLAADLVRLNVSAIVAGGGSNAPLARADTERRAFQVDGYSTSAELVASLYQSITSLNSEKP
jgi:putative ABC transport system substrate-binding protein